MLEFEWKFISDFLFLCFVGISGNVGTVASQNVKANPNPKMKWVSDERALAGVHFS